MHALFLAVVGTFFNNVSENCIAWSLHQQSWLESQEDAFPQWLLLLHSGQMLGLIGSESKCWWYTVGFLMLISYLKALTKNNIPF